MSIPDVADLDAQPGTNPGGAEVQSSGPPRGPRVVVLSGGIPSDAQAAALAAALLSVEARDTSTSPGVSGWQHAALREGVGLPRVAERADLDGAEPR